MTGGGSRTIRDVEVVVCSPGRNYVTLRIETADGLIGWGDATLNGRELAVASYLRDHLAPLLLGKDSSGSETSGTTCIAAPTGAGGR